MFMFTGTHRYISTKRLLVYILYSWRTSCNLFPSLQSPSVTSFVERLVKSRHRRSVCLTKQSCLKDYSSIGLFRRRLRSIAIFVSHRPPFVYQDKIYNTIGTILSDLVRLSTRALPSSTGPAQPSLDTSSCDFCRRDFRINLSTCSRTTPRETLST